jgi:hypothetical protein
MMKWTEVLSQRELSAEELRQVVGGGNPSMAGSFTSTYASSGATVGGLTTQNVAGGFTNTTASGADGAFAYGSNQSSSFSLAAQNPYNNTPIAFSTGVFRGTSFGFALP